MVRNSQCCHLKEKFIDLLLALTENFEKHIPNHTEKILQPKKKMVNGKNL